MPAVSVPVVPPIAQGPMFMRCQLIIPLVAVNRPRCYHLRTQQTVGVCYQAGIYPVNPVVYLTTLGVVELNTYIMPNVFGLRDFDSGG